MVRVVPSPGTFSKRRDRTEVLEVIETSSSGNKEAESQNNELISPEPRQETRSPRGAWSPCSLKPKLVNRTLASLRDSGLSRWASVLGSK